MAIGNILLYGHDHLSCAAGSFAYQKKAAGHSTIAAASAH